MPSCGARPTPRGCAYDASRARSNLFDAERAAKGATGHERDEATNPLLVALRSEFWPRTPKGRVPRLLRALQGVAVFGHITASFAGLLVGSDTAAQADGS